MRRYCYSLYDISPNVLRSGGVFAVKYLEIKYIIGLVHASFCCIERLAARDYPGQTRQMIQQSNVPVDFRINALEMELSLCKQQIAGFDKALRIEKRRLDEAKEQLASVKYHPLQDFSSTSCQPNECRNRSKKLKHTSTVKF
ncbi:UNVERIFIED_CONTAM: hypothetical protein Slati_1317200 [Sesamum latifolium]|uniref:Uncharacterized protein n=1 Tax=Sesamum latifolium TaxID=2727402 RepID=A0AAW2XKM2_9LAMI